MASVDTKRAIVDAASVYTKPEGKVFEYGTAGVNLAEQAVFRMKSELLNTVVFAVGLLAGLRSRKLKSQTIGVMITASHNPACDNGVKLIDPMGEMLDAEWESYATKLANTPLEKLGDVYEELIKEIEINMDNPARVVFARDTRASGSRLVGVLTAAFNATGVEYTDFKYLTTPQLHYIVRCKNTLGTPYEYGEPTEQGYYEKINADRIVYYYLDTGNIFKLLDGDRIATLAASFIGELARNAGIANKLRIGVVQTAYANGASTQYVEKVLKLPVICTPTGVKHLHHAAMRFDVGVYFEANGHGTITFSEQALKIIKTTEPQSPAQQYALQSLIALTELINQAVGDAISDLLLVEVILAHKCWTPKEWISTYTDLPNRLVRIEVADRSIFKAVDAERKLESPPGLQQRIDALQSRYNRGRSFARASGTEDAVRVYAEAASRSEADDLATRVAAAVQEAVLMLLEIRRFEKLKRQIFFSEPKNN
ncbi:N-acetylglucosamine-phosphate mutase [Coccidioides immitis RMSCC 3703]|uniref:Phosphoacetylglucosamine mutase n=1 Tax=Coccidioides immitis RMSCC 3703 TaxID=454286 RepID=A0A0J8QHH4_COCIT|nr:N-acetylglucosamine-phosphate mutase [Coccidioides immitis RMSCC 3703]